MSAGRPHRRRAEVGNMRIGKTIGGKLRWGFGGILAVVIVLSTANLIATAYERTTKDTYKKAIEMSRQMSDLKQDIKNNDLHLRNLLLNGDPRETSLMTQGLAELNQAITRAEDTSSYLGSEREHAKGLLEQVRGIEKEWGDSFAMPLAD